MSSPGVAASNTGSLQACWVIIEAANENQRLTKAELMTSAFLGGVLSSPQQVTRCQKKHVSDFVLGDEKLRVSWEGGGVCLNLCWLWFVYS